MIDEAYAETVDSDDPDQNGCPKLDPRERHFRITGPRVGMRLFLRRLSLSEDQTHRAVLYVHGATFPSALSVAHRFEGRSWRDALCEARFTVWALDFYGFGCSDRYPEMEAPAGDHPPLGLAVEAAEQLAAAARFILKYERLSALSLISHSWGSMAAGRFAGAHVAMVDRWVLFAPIARREPARHVPALTGPAWRLVSIEDQWSRFVEDVPSEALPVLSRMHFEDWARRYLATDPDSLNRTPPAVKIPMGPSVEILRAWQGELAYDPALVEAPVAIIRGSWDGLVPDEDARWLFDAFSRSRAKRDIKIGGATHLMHLEAMRLALWRESVGFLLGADTSPVPELSASPTPEPRNPQPKAPHPMTAADPSTNIPGYNPGTPEVARSPITMKEWEELKTSAFFSDEDIIYLRLSHDVLKDQVDELLKVWRGIIFLHPHLRAYDANPQTGEVDAAYAKAVGRRFGQWILDTAKAEYGQTWLDYQYEIGLRHHRTKKNKTDNGHTLGHIRARDLIAFSAAIVAPMKPYLEKGGHSAEIVSRMYDAWWKSMILQVTLWSQPYMREGDF
jgi:pimeloyl-ACP methyl ester carboxylesterase